jgi:hypothetical protein
VGHQRGEPVVVTEPDLLGGHRVVLVDDRQHAEGEQPVHRLPGVAVVPAPGEVVGGEQHLADGHPVGGERVGVGLHQAQLPDARGGLGGRQVARPPGEAQRGQPGGDRAGGHQHDLAAGRPQRPENTDQRLQPVGVQPAGQGGQRRGADLDHDTAGAGDLRPLAHRSSSATSSGSSSSGVSS